MRRLLILTLLAGLAACTAEDAVSGNRDPRGDATPDPTAGDAGLARGVDGGSRDAGRQPDGAPRTDLGSSLADEGTHMADATLPPDTGSVEQADASRTPEDGGAGAPDAGPGCAAANPFVPPGQPTGWLHASTGLFTTSQGAANHRGQDVIVRTGQPQLLVGKFAYGPFDKDLKQEEVEVFVQDRPPCGPWLSLGVVLTSEEGEHGEQYGIRDDGGRVFFTLPPELARPVGWTPVRLLVRGDHSQAALNLIVVEPGTALVVFDIDGTLTTRDFELMQDLWADLFNGEYSPEMRPGGPEVAWGWHELGYLLLYMTGRPDWLRRISHGWLVERGFPPGALHLTDTTAQALPTADGVGRYKAEYLNLLQDPGQVLLHAAYGNAPTDIQAYRDAQLPLERTFILGEHGGEDGTVALPGYREQLEEVRRMPPAEVSAPQSRVGWD